VLARFLQPVRLEESPMRKFSVSSTVVALALCATACRGQNEATVPADPTTASAPQERSQPMTVAGCLRAGEAADTFILTAAATEGSQQPGTYQLVGNTASLADHIGNRVEVSGTLESEQELATRTQAIEKERPKGTSGTPTVETKSEVEVRRLEVASAKRISGDCKP
jgi:hypothetical protein